MATAMRCGVGDASRTLSLFDGWVDAVQRAETHQGALSISCHELLA